MIVADMVMRWLPLMFDSKKRFGQSNLGNWELRLPPTVQKRSTLLHNSKLFLGVNACLPCQPCDLDSVYPAFAL